MSYGPRCWCLLDGAGHPQCLAVGLVAIERGTARYIIAALCPQGEIVRDIESLFAGEGACRLVDHPSEWIPIDGDEVVGAAPL
jgi:hypothetical protein